MKARFSIVAAIVMFSSSAAAQVGDMKIPGYIKAASEPLVKAFGAEVAKRAFSGEFTKLRQARIVASTRNIPGLKCAENAGVVLFNFIPYPIRKGAVSWIEQYFVGCERRVRRSLLMLIQDGKISVLEMIRGESNTDPLLQRDARPGVLAIAAAKGPKDCKQVEVFDAAITAKPDKLGIWEERWDVSACKTVLKVQVRFMPSPKGGTTWSASVIP